MTRIALQTWLACCIFVTACGASPTASDLEKIPESHLYYPGSTLVSTSRQDEASTAEGIRPALLRHDLLVKSATADQIYTWYIEKLTAIGWTLQLQKGTPHNYDVFTRGDRQVFEVGTDPASPNAYSIAISAVPATCATSPPTRFAFLNCT